MNKALLAQLTDAERLLWHETDPKELAKLDEDAVDELHTRVRRARNKYVGLYRREASAKVSKVGARGQAYPKNTRNRAKAEVFEEALSRVSRRLGVLAKQAAAELRAERLAAARAGRSSGPDAGTPEAKSVGGGRTPRHRKNAGELKREASSRAAGARRQAKRDAR